MFGLLYELEVEDKPEYQWYGNFYPVFAISELAKKYRSLSDEQIIQKLIDLRENSHKRRKNRTGSLLGTDEDAQIEVERQLLTVAFVLNHGINGKEVEFLCMVDSRYKDLFWEYIAFSLDIAKLWNDSEFCLDPEFSHYSLQAKKELKESGEKIGIDATIFEKMFPLPSDIVFDLIAKNGGFRSLEKIRNELFLRYGTVERLKKEGKFPPYGVALSIHYEDLGNDILPWNKDFTNILKAKLLNYMHDIADSSASAVYKVILAAFCCQCFEEVPTFKSVQIEFRSTKLNKGKYSSSVNIPLKEANIDWRPRNKRAAEDAINERRIDPDKEILTKIKSIIAIMQAPPTN